MDERRAISSAADNPVFPPSEYVFLADLLLREIYIAIAETTFDKIPVPHR